MPLLLFIRNPTCLTKVIVFCGLATIYNIVLVLVYGVEGKVGAPRHWLRNIGITSR